MRILGNNKIGGEFEIDPDILSDYPKFVKNDALFFYATGRSAFQAILKYITQTTRTIHLPFYICESVVYACNAVGIAVKFYELDDNFLFPLEHLEVIKNNEALLTVNYFGFIDDNALISHIKNSRPDILIISDQVQSFWTFDKSQADFSFTSLRKHFAIPDGALINTKDKHFKPDIRIPENQFYKNKLIGSLLKKINVKDEVFLHFFRNGEIEIDADPQIYAASVLSQYLFSKTDFVASKAQRMRNYHLIYDIGKHVGIEFVFPYRSEVVPMHVPVLIKNRDQVRKKLMDKNIFLPVHWPLAAFNRLSAFAKKMAENELSLIVDQRCTQTAIEFQLESLNKGMVK